MRKLPIYKRIKLSELTACPQNSRTHSASQIDQVSASIAEFGFLAPIIIDASNMIIAGHARCAAARKLDMPDVPCVRVEYLTEAQRRAYVLADNRLTELGGWDEEILKTELAALDGFGFDVTLTGFDLPDNTTTPELDLEYKSVYEVVTVCVDETEQESVYNLLTNLGYKCRVLSI